MSELASEQPEAVVPDRPPGRILGTAAHAEDAVQDAWSRWSAADRSRVVGPQGVPRAGRVERGPGPAAFGARDLRADLHATMQTSLDRLAQLIPEAAANR
jgi:hypothetical protein